MFYGESTAMRALQPELKEGEVGTPLNTYVAGCAGGILQCLVLVPSDVVKCSMQANSLQPEANGSTGNALQQTLQCCTQIYRAEGLRGFYRGFGITALREAPSIGLYFFAYKFAREALTKLQGLEAPSTSAIMLAGGFAGALSWSVIYPFDVIKTNMQISGSSGSAAEANSTSRTSISTASASSDLANKPPSPPSSSSSSSRAFSTSSTPIPPSSTGGGAG
ncbi:MC/SLC25 family protein, partial [archaeon]